MRSVRTANLVFGNPSIVYLPFCFYWFLSGEFHNSVKICGAGSLKILKSSFSHKSPGIDGFSRQLDSDWFRNGMGLSDPRGNELQQVNMDPPLSDCENQSAVIWIPWVSADVSKTEICKISKSVLDGLKLQNASETSPNAVWHALNCPETNKIHHFRSKITQNPAIFETSESANVRVQS